MKPLPATENDAIREAKIRAGQLAGDFESMFGQPSRRTAAQRNVLAHLAVCAGDDANSYRFNESKDGIALVAAGIHRDGAKSILKVIERQLSIASNAKRAKAPKPTTKR